MHAAQVPRRGAKLCFSSIALLMHPSLVEAATPIMIRPETFVTTHLRPSGLYVLLISIASVPRIHSNFDTL